MSIVGAGNVKFKQLVTMTVKTSTASAAGLNSETHPRAIRAEHETPANPCVIVFWGSASSLGGAGCAKLVKVRLAAVRACKGYTTGYTI